jgi:M6 family metalloprotease-like protein
MSHYYFHISIFLIAILVFAAGTANAVPANPAPFDLVQPNGFGFAAQQTGDERAVWIETIDGYTLIQNENGWWTYARDPLTASSEVASEFTLFSTGYRVGDVDPHQVGIPKHLRLADVSSKVDSPSSKLATSVMPTSVTFKSLPSPVPYYSSVTGTRNVLVILINFMDTVPDSSHTSSYYDDLVFNQSTTANSMYKYYREVSYNTLNITGVVNPTWCQSTHNLSYYGADSSSTGIDDKNEYIFELAREAVQLADPYIDFSQYDDDGDGVVDHVMIVHAGAGQESSGISTDIWSHQGTIQNYYPDSGWESDGENVDGVQVIDYTMLAEGSPLGVFAHEFGHDLGLPDLYNTNPDTGGTVAGSWCLMDSGSWNDGGDTPSHLSAWCKIDLGWITPTLVDSPQSYLVDQVEINTEAFKITTPVLEYQNEYFLVENREKVGFDSYIPESGILIWHIDDWMINEYRSNNTMNAYSIKGVVPEMPDGTLDHAAYSANDGQAVFNTTTTPNSNTNAGYLSNVSIDNIGSEGSSIRVDFFGGEHVPPVFSNEYPANTSMINNQTPLISINVIDADIGVNISTVVMNVNGGDMNLIFTPFADGYNIENATTQPFADGQVVNVSVSASDHASNTMICNWSFTVDTSVPIVTITSPTNDTTVSTSTIAVTGTATDDSGVTSLTVNGNSVTIESDGSFTTTVPLTNGVNIITVVATDAAGNTATQSVTVTYTPPSITGDLNGNGMLDTGDVTLTLRMAVGLTTPDLLGDMNDNGIIDTGDATLMLRTIVGLE